MKRIRKIPRDLPHARLYLDDIEEVVNVITDAYRENKWLKLTPQYGRDKKQSPEGTTESCGSRFQSSLRDAFSCFRYRR